MPEKKIPDYVFTKVEPREPLTEMELIKMARREIAAGVGNTPEIKISNKFVKRQNEMVRAEKRVCKVKPPNWLKAHFAKHSPINEVLDQLIKRLDRIPSEQILRETQIGLNELGRRPGGYKLLKELLTQEFVNKYLEKGV
jgi:hypothetical protein